MQFFDQEFFNSQFVIVFRGESPEARHFAASTDAVEFIRDEMEWTEQDWNWRELGDWTLNSSGQLFQCDLLVGDVDSIQIIRITEEPNVDDLIVLHQRHDSGALVNPVVP